MYFQIYIYMYINHKGVILFETDTKILYISPAHRNINYLCLVLVIIANDSFLLPLLLFFLPKRFYFIACLILLFDSACLHHSSLLEKKNKITALWVEISVQDPGFAFVLNRMFIGNIASVKRDSGIPLAFNSL